MKKLTAAITCLLLLLCLCACGKKPLPSPTQEPAAQPGRGETVTTAPPSQDAEPTAEPTPKPTPEPAPTFEPAPEGSQPTAAPIPEATPAPSSQTAPDSTETAPAGPSLAWGSFRSDTGTALNLVADWTISPVNEETAKITVNLSLESYSLDVGERRGNTLTFNGQDYSFMTDPIEIGSGFHKTLIYIWSREIERSQLGFDLSIVWNLKGSYSGQAMETVELSGSYQP